MYKDYIVIYISALQFVFWIFFVIIYFSNKLLKFHKYEKFNKKKKNQSKKNGLSKTDGLSKKN